ncbi:MAG: dihydrofolate reductase [Clostridiales bacterium]|nr:MAG: dihydrofolate reductase [Clostridiales bacterium]
MNILVTYDYGESFIKTVGEMGYTVTYKAEKNLLDEDLKGIDILICYNPFRRLSAAAYEDLSHIILSSTGIDQLPEAIRRSERIKVTHNRHGYATPIGEWIVMMLLVGFKRLNRLYDQSLERRWKLSTDALELTDKRVLFLGTGNIAVQAVQRLKPFGIQPIGLNRSGRSSEHFAEIHRVDQLVNVIGTADAVVVCLPQTAETHCLVNAQAIAAMKDDAVLINISRGAVIDESALTKALANGKFRFCALDVVSAEPLAADSPLWQFEQLFITPHNSWVSEYRNARRLNYIMENLRRIKDGSALLYAVDPKRGY